MTADPGYTIRPPAESMARLFVPITVGVAVAVGLGVYGRLHEPTGIAVST